MRRLLVGIMLCMAMLNLLGCGDGEVPVQQPQEQPQEQPQHQEKTVHIRIRNASTKDIDKFWLGSGGVGNESAPYGEIPHGTTTDYQAFTPVLSNYRKYNFLTTDGMRYLDVVYPENHIGVPELPPGSYTYSIDIVNDKPVLTLITD